MKRQLRTNGTTGYSMMTYEIEGVVHFHLFTDHETKGCFLFSMKKESVMGKSFEELFQERWIELVNQELNTGKKRLQWVTCLSEEFCEWMKHIQVKMISQMSEDTWFLFCEARETGKTEAFQFECDENPRCQRVVPKTSLTKNENEFVENILQQIDFHQLFYLR